MFGDKAAWPMPEGARAKATVAYPFGVSIANRTSISDGDWLIMKWARGLPPGAVDGRVALIARGEPDEGYTHHLKRIRRVTPSTSRPRYELWSDNPAVPPVPAEATDQVIALLVRSVSAAELAPPVGTELAASELLDAFGLGATDPPTAPWSRVDGHLFVFASRPGVLVAADRAQVPVERRGAAETAYVLVEVASSGSDRWRYHGPGRWREEDAAWSLQEEVDFSTWRRLGQGRSASRHLPDGAEDDAKRILDALMLTPGPGAYLESPATLPGRRCRIVRRSSGGGVVIDGGPDGFKARTVSATDLAWVLLADADVLKSGGALDEPRVNRLRYLTGTPKNSTRWIDTRWALLLHAAW